MNKTVICISFGALVLSAGCGENRVSQDMFPRQSLSAEEQAFIDQQRDRQATGGTITKKKSPRWVYLDGVLVDTNNAQWLWQEGSPTPATNTEKSVPKIP